MRYPNSVLGRGAAAEHVRQVKRSRLTSVDEYSYEKISGKVLRSKLAIIAQLQKLEI